MFEQNTTSLSLLAGRTAAPFLLPVWLADLPSKPYMANINDWTIYTCIQRWREGLEAGAVFFDHGKMEPGRIVDITVSLSLLWHGT